MNLHPPQPNRRGVTLAETVMLISVMGTTLSLCAVVLNQAYRAHQTTLDAFRESERLCFWNERLCADARKAVDASVESDLILRRADDETVSYIVQDQRLIRQVERADKLVSQERLEGLVLRNVRWRVETDGRVPLLIGEFEFYSEVRHLDLIEWRSRIGSTAGGEAPHDH